MKIIYEKTLLYLIQISKNRKMYYKLQIKIKKLVMTFKPKNYIP